jgi:SAM-dependent methyltransferase
VAAARERHPGVDVRRAAAEALPFDTGAFDAAIAQLVVHFMSDPVAGLVEMARVTRSGGVVAACVWDHAGASGPLALFWSVARDLDPGVHDESDLAGAREGHLEQLFAAAGLADIEASTVRAKVEYATFDEWWEPFTGGVGPAGAHVVSLDADQRAAFRAACQARLSTEPVVITASAWAARGVVRPR